MAPSNKLRVEKHVEQWKHNRRFAKTIDGQFRDWQINVIFYTALHLIDAALATVDLSVADHTDRNNHVRTNEFFSSVRTQYLDLYRISRITRYDAEPDTWIPQKYLVVSDLVADLLRPIENELGPMISKFVKFEPLELKT